MSEFNIFVKILLRIVPTLRASVLSIRLAKLEALAKDIMPTIPPMYKLDPNSGVQVSDDEGRIKRAFQLARVWLHEVHE